MYAAFPSKAPGSTSASPSRPKRSPQSPRISSRTQNWFIDHLNNREIQTENVAVVAGKKTSKCLIREPRP